MILFPFRFIVQSTEMHFTKEQLMVVKGKKNITCPEPAKQLSNQQYLTRVVTYP